MPHTALPRDPELDAASIAFPIARHLPQPALSHELATLVHPSADTDRTRIAKNTRRGYTADWKQFITFCTRRNLDALPAAPSTIALYYDHLAQRRLRLPTIKRARAAIRHAHTTNGYPSPTDTIIGIERFRAIAQSPRLSPPTPKKTPLTRTHLRAIIAAIDPASPVGLRDRALLLTSWCLSLSRAATCALDVGDLTFSRDRDDVEILFARIVDEHSATIRTATYRKNTDTNDIEPIAALRTWIAHASISHGPLFRPLDRDNATILDQRLNDRTVARIVKKWTTRLKIEGNFTATSLAHGARNDDPPPELPLIHEPLAIPAPRRPRTATVASNEHAPKTSRKTRAHRTVITDIEPPAQRATTKRRRAAITA